MNFNLEDFMTSYIPSDDPSIMQNITYKKEFLELKGNKENIFNHQKLLLRYMKVHDRILNINETGTGKSGVIVNIAEYYKHNNKNIKGTIILVPGASIETEIKNQIIKIGNYPTPDTVSKKNKMINEWYTINTFYCFRELIKTMDDDVLQKNFSNYLIFIDEFHKIVTETDEEDKVNMELYNNLWRLFHVVKNTKVMLLTATPMIRDVKDFVPIINLLNPIDKQLPPNINYNNISLKSLEPFLRGKISYVKKIEEKIKIKYMGEKMKIPKFLEHEILNQDYNEYIIEYNDDIFKTKVIRSIKEALDYIINNVIPDGYHTESIYYDFNNLCFEYAKENTDNIVIKIKDKFLQPVKGKFTKKCIEIEDFNGIMRIPSSLRTKVDTQEILFQIDMKKEQYDIYKKQKSGDFQIKKRKASIYVDSKSGTLDIDLSVYDNKNEKEILDLLSINSCKLHFIINNELKNHKNSKPGKSMFFLFFIHIYDKLIIHILEKLGYSSFEGIEAVTKKKRYLLLDKTTINSLDFFNSEKNIHGEYIQIIIFGPSYQEGINLDSIKRCYIIQPFWHDAYTYQAISRSIRANSHDRLYELNKGKKVDIEIYKLAATYEQQEMIDLKMYYNSEFKKININKMITNFKKVSFDGILNAKRNDTEELFLNDLGKIFTYKNQRIGVFKDIYAVRDHLHKYNLNIRVLSEDVNDYINYNDYNIDYTQDKINFFKHSIINSIKKNNFTEITEYFSKNKSNTYIVLKALMAIKSESPLVTYSNGFKEMCIKISNNCAFPAEFLDLQSKRFTYNHDIVLDIDYTTDVIEEASSYSNIVYKLENMTTEEIKNTIYENNKKNNKTENIDILEYFLKKKYEDENTNKEILQMFDYYIYEFRSPKNWISKLSKYKRYINIENLELEGEPGYTDEVIVCHLYNDVTSYAIPSLFSNSLRLRNKVVRIYDFKNEEFKNDDFIYKKLVLDLFTKRLENILADFKSKNIPAINSFATVMGDNKFRIHQDYSVKMIDNVKIIQFNGKVCSNFDKDILQDLLHVLESVSNKKFPEEIFKKKNTMCKYIQNFFEKNNLLYRFI
jgi:hypothetical protein